jgi:hypothetical protein
MALLMACLYFWVTPVAAAAQDGWLVERDSAANTCTGMGADEMCGTKRKYVHTYKPCKWLGDLCITGHLTFSGVIYTDGEGVNVASLEVYPKGNVLLMRCDGKMHLVGHIPMVDPMVREYDVRLSNIRWLKSATAWDRARIKELINWNTPGRLLYPPPSPIPPLRCDVR